MSPPPKTTKTTKQLARALARERAQQAMVRSDAKKAAYLKARMAPQQVEATETVPPVGTETVPPAAKAPVSPAAMEAAPPAAMEPIPPTTMAPVPPANGDQSTRSNRTSSTRSNGDI